MPVPNDHLCQACDQPMMQDYMPEQPYRRCVNEDCVCNKHIQITECPKCGSKHLLCSYETTQTDCLDDDGKWYRLYNRGIIDKRFICQACGIIFQPRKNMIALYGRKGIVIDPKKKGGDKPCPTSR
jgi:hypothetical protein